MPEHTDISRLREEYESRSKKFADSKYYTLFNRANLFAYHQRQRNVINLLNKHNFFPLAEHSILEMGCGGGGVLAEYLTYGANRASLHGLDLLPDRLSDAKNRLPEAVGLSCADGQSIPYRDGSFDLILQYTAFSSVLDPIIRKNIAQEMMRVLRKPGGMILWYDFWLNPTNPQTRGIKPDEIRELFPSADVKAARVTLAPPIARRIVPLSWVTALFLERLKFLSSHFLVTIHPRQNTG